MRPDAAGEIGAGGVGGATCEASKYRVTVRVTFDDESTVEMSEQLKRDEVGGLYLGDIVPIRYDPTDHSKPEIDQPALSRPDRRRNGRAP